jgi:hypothetical protein
MNFDLSGQQSVDRVFERRKYKNSKRQVGIAEEYYHFIRAIAFTCNIDMSLITNNLLSLLFDNEDFMLLLKKEAKDKSDKYLKEMDKILQNLAL